MVWLCQQLPIFCLLIYWIKQMIHIQYMFLNQRMQADSSQYMDEIKTVKREDYCWCQDAYLPLFMVLKDIIGTTDCDVSFNSLFCIISLLSGKNTDLQIVQCCFSVLCCNWECRIMFYSFYKPVAVYFSKKRHSHLPIMNTLFYFLFMFHGCKFTVFFSHV